MRKASPAEDLSAKKALAYTVIDRLKQEYPDAGCTLDYDHAWQLLVSVRLAAQCTDARVNIVTERLFSDFPTLQSFAEASEEDIAEVIKSCGLFRTKARDLHACAVVLLAEYGGRVPDTMEELLRLPGVGRKTANLILGDIFGKPAIVCDTHCIRLSNRLGFVRDEKDPVKVEKALRGLVLPEESSDFCHRLVLFGREHCTARAPRCTDCPLADICPSFGKMR